MSDTTVVQGDTSPDIVAIIHDGDDASAAIDLTGASVNFQMRKPDDKRYTVNSPALIDSPTDGRVRYEWGPNDLAVAGEYQAQFEVTFADGKVQTTRTPNVIIVRRQ